jgi:hypothetical protein
VEARALVPDLEERFYVKGDLVEAAAKVAIRARTG